MSKRFGEILKNLRIKENIRQIDLAKQINVDNSTISYWEKGIKEPDIETLIKLANIFNVTLDYLLGRNENFNNCTKDKNKTKRVTYKERNTKTGF